MTDESETSFVCEACGETVAEDDGFCGSCGRTLSVVGDRRIGRLTPLITAGSRGILLPFSEVLKAEELLTTLEILG